MPGSLFAFIYTFSGEVIEHDRSIYTFMDLIGDLGGVNDLIVLFVSIFMGSISEHSFFSKIMGKLYLVRSVKNTIFSNPPQIFKKNIKTKFTVFCVAVRADKMFAQGARKRCRAGC